MPRFEVQCGDIDGRIDANSPGTAYRKLLAKARRPVALGAIARFRRVDRDRMRGEGKWRYQNPPDLEKSR